MILKHYLLSIFYLNVIFIKTEVELQNRMSWPTGNMFIHVRPTVHSRLCLENFKINYRKYLNYFKGNVIRYSNKNENKISYFILSKPTTGFDINKP